VLRHSIIRLARAVALAIFHFPFSLFRHCPFSIFRSLLFAFPNFPFPFSIFRLTMLNALRYYWIISKGYRLRPWRSPYIRWRLETFFGPDAADLNARTFFSLLWRERARMERFLEWVDQRRGAQRGG
jgi:hypothetical protein